jgi:rfaE bifunctional protein nucleotidyltransferase chain/domain
LAALLASRGDRPVVLLTPLAADAAGVRLRGLLTGVSVIALPGDGGTPVKRRVRAGGQTLLRLDSGGGSGAVEQLPTAAEEALQQAAGVLVSDYGRGLTSQPGVRAALEQAARRVPLVWDPHPRGADPVAGTVLATPNLQELSAADGDPVAVAAARLRVRWGVQALCVTMGDRGAVLVAAEADAAELSTVAVHGADTCGAGDAFAAAAGVALAGGTPPEDAARAGVRAASRHVAAGGAAALARRTDAPELVADGPLGAEGVLELTRRTRERGGTVVATGGCFDLLHAGHVATLRAARSLGDVLVVCLNSDDSVRRLKGPQRPLVGHDDRVAVLSALDCVDGVLVFGEDTPCEVLDVLRPDIWVKGGDYVAGMLPEDEVLARWGGRSVVVPYLPGRSTSELVARARTPASV